MVRGLSLNISETTIFSEILHEVGSQQSKNSDAAGILIRGLTLSISEENILCTFSVGNRGVRVVVVQNYPKS